MGLPSALQHQNELAVVVELVVVVVVVVAVVVVLVVMLGVAVSETEVFCCYPCQHHSNHRGRERRGNQ